MGITKHIRLKTLFIFALIVLAGCITPPSYCGDNYCSDGENYSNCSADCIIPQIDENSSQNIETPSTVAGNSSSQSSESMLPTENSNPVEVQSVTIQLLDEDGIVFDIAGKKVYYSGTFCPADDGKCTEVKTKLPLSMGDITGNNLPVGKYTLTLSLEGYKDTQLEFVVGNENALVQSVRMVKK